MLVSDLLGDVVTVDFKGMEVVFRPSAYTFEDQETLVGFSEGDPSSWEKLRKMLARVLVSWDLEDDQGPIPATAEGMKRVPIGMFGPLMEALQEAMTPSEDEKKGLGQPLSSLPLDSTKQPEEPTPHNGMSSSKQLATSASLLGNLPDSLSAG